MTKLFRVCFVVIFSAALAAGCAARGVRIAELKDRPDKCERKTVSVEGVVTRSYGAGFLGNIVPFQGYTVDDGSGEITVLARSTRTSAHRCARQGQREGQRAGRAGRPLDRHLQEDDRKIKD